MNAPPGASFRRNFDSVLPSQSDPGRQCLNKFVRESVDPKQLPHQLRRPREGKVAHGGREGDVPSTVGVTVQRGLYLDRSDFVS